MKLLLKEDVQNLGVCGDEVEVKGGYGRNFLIPQGKALLATPKNVKQFAHQKSIVQAKTKKFIDAAKVVADEISKVKCEIKKKVGEQGKLFGSVTAQNIHDLLSEGGVEIDRRKIQLAEPIKTLGDYKIPVKLHPAVTAEINLSVVAEVVATEEVAEETPAPEENA